MLKIPPFDRLRVVSEVEPPKAGKKTNTKITKDICILFRLTYLL
jgi:hypothetical protein